MDLSKKNNNSISGVLTPFILSVWLISSGAAAQAANCFDNIKIEPNFIGFTEPKKSNLGHWYKNTFGLTTVKEFAFPDGSVTGILMNKDEFIVEVFHRDDALKATDVIELNKHQVTGVMKFGLFTNADLPKLKQCLTQSGVNATRIWKDINLHVDMLQVTDPSGNVIEVITRQK
jgi:hypothetical protein